jgi:hypothetical protein
LSSSIVTSVQFREKYGGNILFIWNKYLALKIRILLSAFSLSREIAPFFWARNILLSSSAVSSRFWGKYFNYLEEILGFRK